MEWDSSLLGEDDSLIQPTPNKTPKPHLNLNRVSPIKGFTASEDSVPMKLNCSSGKDTSNKENVTANKFEGPKLNMEPVQMKKKKKGGGYNLRKSLAWNRAFFTDEGVLDPIELSMISGTLGNSSSEGLSAINEEAMDSLSDSSAVRSQKDKEPVSLPPKHTSPARTRKGSTSTASLKVLSTHVAKRSVSRVGSSPQSLPSSSLKRPANVNAYKAVTKESKLPKLPPVPKTGHSSLPGNLTTSSKQNQILRPVLNVQRNMEIKGNQKSVKMTLSKAKAGSELLPSKSSASYARRNKVNPPVNLQASTQVCPVVGNKVHNSGQNVTPDDVPPSVEVDSSVGQDVTSQQPASLPLNNAIKGRTLQPTQVQSMKPSGLRMPSPSLGFFGQSKTSVSHCFSRRVVDSNPRVGKLGDRRPPQLPPKIPEAVNSNMPIGNATVSSSRYDLNAVSNHKIAQDVGGDTRKEQGKISHEENCAQNAVDVNRAKTTIKNPCEEEKSGNSAVIDHDVPVESQTGDVSNSTVLNSVMLRSNSVSCVQDLHQPSHLRTDISDTSTVEEFLVADVDKPSVTKEGNSKKLVGDLQNCTSEEIGYKSFEISDPTNFKLENSEFLSQHIHTSQLENILMRNEITDNSHIKETVLQMPSMILTAKCNNSHKQSLEVDDLDYPSGKLLVPQTSCLEVKQISNSIYGLPSDDCIFLEKDKGAEECKKQVIETFPFFISDEIIKNEVDNSGAADVSGGMEGEGFDASKMAGEEILRKSVFGVESHPPVANHSCLLDTNVSFDVILSDAATSLDLHSYSSEASESLVVETPASFEGNKLSSKEVNEKNLTTPDPADQILFDGPYLESQMEDVNQTSLSSESQVCDEEQKLNPQNIVETDTILHGYSQIELEKYGTLPQVELVMQKSEARSEAANMSDISQIGDDLEHLADGIVPGECCKGLTSVPCNQHAAGSNFTEGFEKTEQPKCCIFVEEVSEYNSKLLLRNCLYEETTGFEKSKKSSVLGSGVDAIPEKGEPSESDLKSSRAFTDGFSPFPSKVNGHDGDKVNGGSCNDESRSSCREIEPSSEKCKVFSGSQIRQSVELGGLLEGDLTLAGSLNQSIQLTNTALTDENNPEVCQDTDSLLEDTNCDLGTSLCQKKDQNTTVPIDSKESISTSNETNSMIIPPRNAVPFSDEWLAAIEAAGEELLTMKSGAVQNSPPDKSLPEPSPWSPVKKKTNSIGPYDCTKFSNNLSFGPQ